MAREICINDTGKIIIKRSHSNRYIISVHEDIVLQACYKILFCELSHVEFIEEIIPSGCILFIGGELVLKQKQSPKFLNVAVMGINSGPNSMKFWIRRPVCGSDVKPTVWSQYLKGFTILEPMPRTSMGFSFLLTKTSGLFWTCFMPLLSQPFRIKKVSWALNFMDILLPRFLLIIV